ncbi:hypothetical protein Runsl_4063 [Runella slithyformis DSM 19594]|uniref:Uncharacterized protein n=1 Tax=Runella slithyformis (strain ATCC 29530 / DSM 19594 / LMG 11500 / NCIMB 11436 / LSU 4) TaxID=761193 RepID=A0A7U3ZND6_RUNSL|nr:hypothetical protein Runsl_4063 [Runella slithyformis DSM 19594]
MINIRPKFYKHSAAFFQYSLPERGIQNLKEIRSEKNEIVILREPEWMIFFVTAFL